MYCMIKPPSMQQMSSKMACMVQYRTKYGIFSLRTTSKNSAKKVMNGMNEFP